MRSNTPVLPLIRRARPADLPALREMHARSLRELAFPHYRPEVIESFLEHVGTLDDSLIEDGYWLAESGGEIVASGGWSEREPAYLGAIVGVRPSPRARIRGVFVHPAHARRGLGRALVERAEREARGRGHAEIALDATLTGVPLYASMGYRPVFTRAARLPGGSFEVVHMRKRLMLVP